MRVVVTGATGFVGRHVTETLVADGHHVTALIRGGTPPAGAMPVIWGTCTAGLAEQLRSIRPHAVVHAAGRINGTMPGLIASNVTLTSDLVAAMARAAPDAALVHLSSVSAVERLGAYGIAKRRAERVVQRSRLTRWTILQPALLYGRHDRKNVAALVRMVRRWPVVPVLGPGLVKLQPLHVLDLCDVIGAVLRGAGRNHGAYILAGPRQEYLVDMIRQIQLRIGRHRPLLPVPLQPVQGAIRCLGRLLPWARLPVQQIAHLHAHPPWDTGAARSDLRFAPCVFADGLARMLASPSPSPAPGTAGLCGETP